MFASALPAGSTTGVVNNGFALGLKSGTTCEAVTVEEVSVNCIDAAGLGTSSTARGWNTSLVIPGQVRVDICLPVYESPSIWDRADSFLPWQPQTASEDIYIGIQELNSSQFNGNFWGCSSCLGTNIDPAGLYLHCQANTTLAYFQLGNLSTNGVPSPFLNETPSSFDIPSGDGSSPSYSTDTKPQAPLMAAAQAMFGTDSWLATVGSFLDLTGPDDNANLTAYAPFAHLLCQMRPLVNAGGYFTETIDDFCNLNFDRLGRYETPAELFASHVRAFFYIFEFPEKARAVINTGFFANSYILNAARDEANSHYSATRNLSNAIYRYDGLQTRPVVPVVSTAALVVVSILVALQAAGVLLLLAYLYSARVWTRTLDAFAMVRIGAQLARLDMDAPGALGVGGVSRTRRRKLWERDGLIDTSLAAPRSRLVPPRRAEDGVELGLLPPPYSPRSDGSGSEGGGRGGEESAGPEDADADATMPSSLGSYPAYEPGREQHEGLFDRSGEVAEEAREGASRTETSSATAAGLGEESRRDS